ncbi:MAG: nitrilase, partial [Deltaproteobacteria bacterium]|nr:nitrilase [Deltaproteobacteria bacterium]
LAGVEVIVVPHASPGAEGPEEKKNRWLRYLPARAYDNTAFLIACNPVGDNGQGLTFSGVALILGPKGEVLDAYAGSKPGLAVARLEAAGLKRIRSSKMGFFRASRRPELYGGLVD